MDIREAFTTHLFACYQDYCLRRELSPNTNTLLEYLISHNLIYEEVMYHFSVLQEFESRTRLQLHKNKTQTIRKISEEFGLHENTIWNLLKDHREKFTGRKTSL